MSTVAAIGATSATNVVVDELVGLCSTCDRTTGHHGDHAELTADGRVLRTWPRSATHHRDCDCLDCRYPPD